MLGQKDARAERLHHLAKQNIKPRHTDLWVRGCLCPMWGTEAARGCLYLLCNKKS